MPKKDGSKDKLVKDTAWCYCSSTSCISIIICFVLVLYNVDCIVIVAVCVWGSTHVQAKPFGATQVHFNAFLQHPHIFEETPHQLNHYIIHPCHNSTKTLLRGEHSGLPSHHNNYTIINRFPGQLPPSLTLTL